MLAAPELALDLPTRLLVRQASPIGTASTVLFSDPSVVARRYGLGPDHVAGLVAIAGLVDRALSAASAG